MRPGRIFLLGVMSIALAVTPAEAKSGSRNSWTQLDNHNWPQDSSTAGCSPCVKWPNAFYDGRWSYGMTKTGAYRTQARAAMKEWNGQPYPSPIFDEMAAGCSGSWNVCLRYVALDKKYCGQAFIHYSGNTIQWGYAYLNNQWRFYDGQVPDDKTGCNLRHVYHHELGHIFSEGHSSISTALMYYAYARTAPEHVDPYAKAELQAVYPPSAGCPCPSLSIEVMRLKEKALQEAAMLDGIPSGDDLGYPG